MLLQGKRIFIVEDNTQNRVVFTITLRTHGALIEFDRWGRDALRRLQAFKPVDLIILDLMLPGGASGYDIFDEIRRVPDFETAPVLAVSAAEPSIAIPHTRRKGFSGFVAKPIDDELFPKQIAAIMAGERVWYPGQHFQGIAD